MVKVLAEQWQSSAGTFDSSCGMDDAFKVKPSVYRYIEKIVRKSQEISIQPTVGRNLAVALFRSVDRRSDEFLPNWVVRAFDEEYNFFVERAHLAHSDDRVPTADGLIDNFLAFERAFHSLIGPYFSGKEELDAILRETNQPTD